MNFPIAAASFWRVDGLFVRKKRVHASQLVPSRTEGAAHGSVLFVMELLVVSLAIGAMNATAGRRLQAHDVTDISQVVAMNHSSHRKPLPGVPSYVTSSVHYDWCMDYERFQVDSFVAKLTNKRGHCVVLDVGMNDGFYTMLSAAMGCRVYAFEVQDLCVAIAHDFLRRNHFEKTVTILHQPVSAHNGEALDIPHLEACDGGFSFSGAFAQGKPKPEVPLKESNWPWFFRLGSTKTVGPTLQTVGRLNLPVHYKKVVRAIALDTFVPPGTMVDILKIDTEGHEPQVLQGALGLYKNKAIRMTWLEVSPSRSEIAWRSYAVLHQIMNWGYTAQFAGNGPCPTGTFQPEKWDAFRQHLNDPTRVCVDVLLLCVGCA